MHYFPIHLLKAIQTGTDILGNPITTLQEPCAACNGYTGRFTEWTAEDAELVGRGCYPNAAKTVDRCSAGTL